MTDYRGILQTIRADPFQSPANRKVGRRLETACYFIVSEAGGRGAGTTLRIGFVDFR